MTGEPVEQGARRTAPSLAAILRIPRPDLRGLAGAVAFLAVLEVLVGGFLLPAIRQPYEGRSIVIWTSVAASFFRNLAAILGVVVSALYVSSFARETEFGRPSRRLTIAILGVLAIPIQALALLVRVTPEMVFLSFTATYFLSLLTVLTAIQWAGPIGPRVGAALLLAPATASFVATVISRLTEGAASLPIALLVLRTLDLGGEALVLAVALLSPILLIRPAARALSRPPGLVAALLALLPSTAYVFVQLFGGDRVAELTSASMGLELAFFKPLYLAALFALSLTVIINLLPASRAEERGIPEIGIGLVLVAAAGQDANTPFKLVLCLLGFQLVSGGVLLLRES